MVYDDKKIVENLVAENFAKFCTKEKKITENGLEKMCNSIGLQSFVANNGASKL